MTTPAWNLSDADWKAGKNINMKDTSDVRRVVLTNDRSPTSPIRIWQILISWLHG